MNSAPEKFFGRRKGKKLKPHRVELIETLLPQLTVPLARHSRESGNPGPWAPAEELLLDPCFRRDDETAWADIWLEVGFGGGEHLAAQALAYPDVLMIGCEPFINGVGKLLALIEEKNIPNIRIYPNDARPLLDALPDGSIGRAFVLFADPWPKNRHADRRFINPDNLNRLARVLKKMAQLRLASDHPVLQSWILMQMSESSDFNWLDENSRDWETRPPDWPPTRYEQKALHGKPIFLTYQKN